LLIDVKRANNKLRDNKAQAVLIDTKYSEMEGELEALRKLKTSADKTLILNVMRRVKKLRQERVLRQTQADNLLEQLLSEHFQLRSSLLAETQGWAQKEEDKGVVLKMMGDFVLNGRRERPDHQRTPPQLVLGNVLHERVVPFVHDLADDLLLGLWA
jgi:hypothetical protein